MPAPVSGVRTPSLDEIVFPFSKLPSQRILIHPSDEDFYVPIDQTSREARKRISGERGLARQPAGHPDPG
jgi:hypothetical protein